ncbi:MAG: hypothetical protein Q8P72_04065 [Candidatus Roizmanbacteria bacterium]|nr:hypothetical protein [Candidatus Roizmanbacteria bacterium]
MRYTMPTYLKEHLIHIGLLSIPAGILAYFIDQYYILGKGWWFLLEFVQ